jgi:hypothetical protein
MKDESGESLGPRTSAGSVQGDAEKKAGGFPRAYGAEGFFICYNTMAATG